MVDQQTLKDWRERISSGMLEYVREGGNLVDIRRVDEYHTAGAPAGYDFDAQAKSLNREYGPIRLDTLSKSGNTSDMTQREGDVPVPLNAAVRDLEDMVTSFDVSRLPDYDNMATSFCGHLLFSRPSLYLNCMNIPNNLSGYSATDPVYVSDPSKNFYHFSMDPMLSGFATDMAGRTLLHPMTFRGTNPFMPLFTTKALNYQTTDVQLKTIEKGQTFYGHSIKYGHYNEDHKAGGTMTIEFLNDRYWSVLQSCYMWLAYIYLVSKTNIVRPSIASQTGGVLDYAGSIYYLVTTATNHRLVYWEKLTGVFPRLVPFSLFSTEDNQKIEGTVSIEFDYGMRSDPKDLTVLEDINFLTFGNWNDAMAAFDAGPFGKGSSRYPTRIGIAMPDNLRGGIMARSNVEASRPVIRRRVDVRGNRDYYLEWFRRGTSTARYPAQIEADAASNPKSAAESQFVM